MKKTIFILVILLVTKHSVSNAQTAIETQLRNFPISNYLNKPIDTLIAHLPLGYDTAFTIGSSSSINRGASLQINYPNEPDYPLSINVYITDAQYITVNKAMETPPEVAWPLALLRKEKVACVTIYTVNYEVLNEGDIY